MTNQESKNLTRESIKIALIQLMQQHSLDEITVTALLERAGVSRAGFYRNYPSKESEGCFMVHPGNLYVRFFKRKFIESKDAYLFVSLYRVMILVSFISVSRMIRE